MTGSLPRHPSLEHLRKQAKQLLAAQRHGDGRCCGFLRRLRRFSEASEADILAARVTLAEAQFVIALHYGFSGWEQLRRHVRSRRNTDANSLEAVMLRCEQEIPEYAAAGVPLAVVAALNHAGIEIDFMEFAAASGWAFSFAYRYDDISPAFMAVRGRPESDGPLEVFAFLPGHLGFGYDMALTRDADALWDFVKKYSDAGTPIMSEHLDGGLITGYREVDGKRQLYFDGTVMPGWIDVGDLNPYAVYVLVKQRDALPREQITRLALKRAVFKGSAHDWHETRQGMAALRAYLADVRDPARDFASTGEWFCWAAFERLMARRCCAVWLQSAAEQLAGEARDRTLTAAGHYEQAFEHYERYRSEVSAGEPTPRSLQERARAPQRIATIAPLLERAIAAERDGLAALERAVGPLE